MASAAPLPVPAPPGRAPELQDGLNRFVYHPLAARLARLLLPTGISPNAVSVAGGLMIWVAALFYTGWGLPESVALGFVFHLLWHVVDGADGDLARLSGRASPTGELVDGVCDYSGHALLYFALTFVLDDQIGWWAWPLAIAAAASHAVQTNHAETQRRSYLFWVYRKPWLKHAQAEGHEVFGKQGWFNRAFGWMAREYLRGANAMTPWTARIDAEAEAAEADPKRRAAIARIARRAWRPLLPFHKIVGPNPRTLILGASMAAGSPLYFFLAEAVLLNVVLLVSVRRHNRVGARVARRLARSRVLG